MNPVHLSVKSVLLLIAVVGTCSCTQNASAQITVTPSSQSAIRVSPTTTLFDFLVNRLRATSADQQTYVREVVRLVEQRRLEKRLVLALERYSRRKNPFFPLPIYERALRVEAAKRGVTVPLLSEIVARSGATASRAVRDSRIR
ncbi:MAG: hypothetical protein AAF802_01110 [Planctomycetota bacterium]